MALSGAPGTVVALRALGLGDLLAGVPALRALRAGLPHHRIVLAAPRWQEPLLQPDRLVDEVTDCAGLRPLSYAPRPVEMAVNLHGRGPQSHRVLGALRSRRWVAFGCPETGTRGPAWRDGEHERERWCRLVREVLGLDADADAVDLTPPPRRPPVSDAVVVHPGAAHRSRQWRPERYAAVARALAADGFRVVVTGGSKERELAGRVAAGAGLAPTAVLAGRTTLTQLAALVAAARLVLSGDTGVAHLATAYRTPSVVLFGPTPPQLWGPPAGAPHTVMWRGWGRGDPWGDEIDPALARLGEAEVLSAVRRRLASAAEQGRR